MFGVEWSNPETLLLNLTNAALGIAVVALFVAVGVGVLLEVRQRWNSPRY